MAGDLQAGESPLGVYISNTAVDWMTRKQIFHVPFYQKRGDE